MDNGRKQRYQNIKTMNKFLLLPWLIFCICVAGPAQAKPRLPRLPSSNLAKVEKTLRNIKKPNIKLPTRKLKLPTAIHQLAQLPANITKVVAVSENAPIRLAVLPLRETEIEFYGIEEPFTATSFVIEEEFEGTKYLWGVTAAHVARIQSAFPAV